MQAKSRKGAAKEIRTVDRKRLNSKIQKSPSPVEPPLLHRQWINFERVQNVFSFYHAFPAKFFLNDLFKWFFLAIA